MTALGVQASAFAALLTKPSPVLNYLARADELCPQSSASKGWKQLAVASPAQAAAQGLRLLLQPEASLHFQADRASSCCCHVCFGRPFHAVEIFVGSGRRLAACDVMNPAWNNHLCIETISHCGRWYDNQR